MFALLFALLFSSNKGLLHNEVWGCAETLPNKDKRTPKTGYEGEENVNCWVVDGLWLKSIYQRRDAPSSVRFVSAIILQSFSFSFRIRMIAKGNISSWEHLPSVDHLNFTFFRIIIWKLFQSRLLVWNARKYCQLCTKKMMNHFSESLTFTSAMIYRNEVRTKHLRMLIFYSAIDNLRRSDEQSFYPGIAYLLKTRDNALFII